MKTWLKVIIILAIIGIVVFVLVNKFYINKPHADIEKATPAFTLNAQELWKQFNQDTKLSDSLYTGKVLEVTGELSRTDKSDTLTYAVFVMEADSLFGDKSIRCEMLPKYSAETSALAVGSAVKIKGYCTGFDQTDVKLSKCSLVK